jgi:uncharacterized membrane protein
MNKLTRLLSTIGLGAGIMYFYDPRQGRRRRALVRDQVNSILNRSDDAIDVAMRDMRNRTRGFFAEMMARVSDEDAPDWLLEERVRSNVGRFSRHVGALDIQAKDRRITLRGPVLADEVDRIQRAAASVRGVQGVDNQMEVHQEPGNIPGLQGWPTKRTAKPEYAQENWSPTMRLLTAVGGGILATYGFARRGIVGSAVSLVGMGMAARGVANLDLKRFFGLGEARDAISIQKAININTPLEELYQFWLNFENFPKCMAHIKEVKNIGEGRSHWKVRGPAGAEMEWEARVVRQVPNQEISWESDEGSQVKNTGVVKFRRNPDGGTRVTIHWNYTPPAGMIGHTVASLMGSNPKQAMDEDLARLKTLFETGKTTVEGREVTRGRMTGAGAETS